MDFNMAFPLALLVGWTVLVALLLVATTWRRGKALAARAARRNETAAYTVEVADETTVDREVA